MGTYNKYKSRFRILKGGKISLVVSAMLVSSLISTAGATDYTLDENTSLAYYFYFGHYPDTATELVDGDRLFITEDGGLVPEPTSNMGIALSNSALDVYIENNGTIQTALTLTSFHDTHGIYSPANGIVTSEIVNNGTISASRTDATGASEAYGISFGGSADFNGTITNNGIISAYAEGYTNKAFGIYIPYYLSGDIVNSETGDINIIVSDTLGVTSTNSYAAGIYTSYVQTTGSILNEGDISVNTNTNLVKGYGIYAYNNYGEIENTGNIDITAEGLGVGIYVQSNNDLYTNESVKNSGNITVVSNDDYAYGIYTAKTYNTLTNSGDINSTSNGSSAYGIYTQVNVGNVTNTGNINVATSINDEYAVGIQTNSNNGSIVNDGNITASAVNILNSYAISIGSGTGTVTNSGTLNGNLNIHSTGLVTNSGTINLSGATTSTIAGSFTQTSTGVLGIDVNFYEAWGEMGPYVTYSSSQLAVTGTATIADNSTLRVDVTGTDALQELFIDSNISNVITAGTLVVDVSKLKVEDNSVLLDFEAIKDGNTLDLLIVEGSTFLDSTIAGGGQTPARNAARALDAINDGNFQDMEPLIDALDAFGNDTEGLAQAVATLTPEVANAGVGAASQIANSVQGIVEQRQNVGFVGQSTGDGMFSDQYIWMKTYGNFGEQNDKDGINGFDLDGYGIGVGSDAEYAPNQKAGIALFYTKANVQTNNVNQEADLDVFTLLTYGNIPVIDAKTNFLYQLGYSLQKTDTTRTLFDATVAKADFTSKTASLDVKLVRNYDVATNWMVQPIVELTYRHYTTPAYSESGSSADLDVQKSTSEELIAGLGVASYYKVDDNSKLITRARVGYDLIDDDLVSTSSFTNATGIEFSSNGIDNGRWSYGAGVGYEINLNQDSNLNFSVDYQAEGSDYHSTSISAKYLMKF